MTDDGPVYVDIPNINGLGDADNCWVNVGEFVNKAAAIAWINENIGGCDADGNVCLLANVSSDDTSVIDTFTPHPCG